MKAKFVKCGRCGFETTQLPDLDPPGPIHCPLCNAPIEP